MKDKIPKFPSLRTINAAETLANRELYNPKISPYLFINFTLTPFGGAKRIQYKTLRGYIRILKQQNKFLKKHNVKAKFDITLPIPD